MVSGVSALVWFGGVGLAARGVFGDGIMTVLVTVIVGSVGHAAVLWRFRRLLHLEALGDALRRRSGSSPRTEAATEG